MTHIKQLIFLFLTLSVTHNVFATEKAISSARTIIGKTRYFEKIAISSSASYDEKDHLSGYQLLVQPIIYNKARYLPFKTPLTKPVRQLGNPTWTITGEQLPATENTCVEADADSCSFEANYPSSVCFHSCIKNGPKFLYFDEKRGNLYIITDTNDVGNAGGKMLVFLANIYTKKIQFLMPINGYVDASVSPSGKYLSLASTTVITIHNLETKEDTIIKRENIWTDSKRRLHSLSVMSWPSDTQFIYRDNIYHDKFKSGWDESTEHTYDIAMRRDINSRALSKAEFPTTPDLDDNNTAPVPLP